MSDSSDLDDFKPKYRPSAQKHLDEANNGSESESGSSCGENDDREYKVLDKNDDLSLSGDLSDSSSSSKSVGRSCGGADNVSTECKHLNNKGDLPSKTDAEVAAEISSLSLKPDAITSNVIFKKIPSKLSRRHGDVIRWLIEAENGTKYTKFITQKTPRLPNSGEAFLVKSPGESVYDYMVDEYTGWVSNGNNSKKGKPQTLLKRYYYMEVESGKIDFSKDIYELRESLSVPKVRLIHYYGSEQSKWHPRPHGNSKKDKNFTRNYGSTKLQIQKKLKDTKKTPKPVFNDLIREVAENCDDYDTRHATEAPRNFDQVKNYKQKVDNERRLLRCEYFSVYEMAKAKQLGEFIAVIEGAPHDIVIVAEPSALQLASKLLIEASGNSSLPQLITMDTTFDLSDTYCTIFVMRNTYFQESPIFPVSYMLHCRKVKEVHVRFLEFLASKLPLNDAVLEKVPFASDREPGLVAAIHSTLESVKLVHCENHFVQDVKHWVQQKAESTSDDVIVYKRCLRQLLKSKSSDEVHEMYEKMKLKWTKSFIEYFEKNLLDDISSRANILSANNFAIFQNISATSNNAETHNSVLKRAFGTLPLRFDSLVLALWNVQLEFMNDFHRSASGESGSGNYTLSEHYKDAIKNKTWSAPFKLPTYCYWNQDKFIDYFKDGIYKHDSNIEKEGDYLQSKKAMAKATCERGNVTLTKFQSFVVQGLYDEGQFLVTKKRGKDTFQCTCISSGLCYHIIAVRYAIDEDVPTDTYVYNLHELKKKGRGYKGRAGKKKPKAQDYELHVNPAPDSAMARGKGNDDEFDDSDDDSAEILWEDDELPKMAPRTNVKGQKPKKSQKKINPSNAIIDFVATPKSIQTTLLPKNDDLNPSSPYQSFCESDNYEQKYREVLKKKEKDSGRDKLGVLQNIATKVNYSTSTRAIPVGVASRKGVLSNHSLVQPYCPSEISGISDEAPCLASVDSAVGPFMQEHAESEDDYDDLCKKYDNFCKDLDRERANMVSGKSNVVSAGEIDDEFDVNTPVLKRRIPSLPGNRPGGTTSIVQNCSPVGSVGSLPSQQPSSNKESQGSSVIVCEPTCFDIANVPDNVSRKFLKNTAFINCFKVGGWFIGDVIDEMVAGILKAFNVHNQVSFFPSLFMQVLESRRDNPKEYLRQVAKWEPLNSDMSLFIVNTGAHWILCTVIYRTKSIVLMNSMRGPTANMHIVFKTMLKFVAAAYVLAGIRFHPSQWHMVVDNAVTQQPNTYDCGPFVCLFAYEIASRQLVQKSIKLDSNRVRNWIMNCLQYTNDCINPKQPGPARPDAEAIQMFPGLVSHAASHQFNVEYQSCMSMLHDQLRGSNHGWNKCEASNCVSKFIGEKQCFCVVCRKWRHIGCLGYEPPKKKVTYFTCLGCWIYKY